MTAQLYQPIAVVTRIGPPAAKKHVFAILMWLPASHWATEAQNTEPGTENLEPGAQNLKPGAQNSEPGSQNLEPGAQNLKLEYNVTCSPEGTLH